MKRLLVASIVTAALAACGGQTRTVTVTPTQTAAPSTSSTTTSTSPTTSTPTTTSSTTTTAAQSTMSPDAAQCIPLPADDTDPSHDGCPAGQITRLQAVTDQGCFGHGGNTPDSAYWEPACSNYQLQSVPIVLYGLPCELIWTGSDYSGPTGG